MNDFTESWTPECVMAVKRKLLRRLRFIWREVTDEEIETLDMDLQEVLRDDDLADRLATEFSWAETSQIIVASRLFRRRIFVWALYPRKSESILALAVDPSGWPRHNPVYL